MTSVLQAHSPAPCEPAVAAASYPLLERRAVTVKNRVQCKQDQLVASLQEFYTEPGNIEKLLPILQGTSPISLRLIDYFVTNYAKKMNTSFTLNGRNFLVHFNYKRELNASQKRLFDPFCRRERIMFQAKGVEPFVTTVGQLNFFRWFFRNQILEHVLENHKAIETDMNTTLKEHYSRSNTTRSSAAPTESLPTTETLSTEKTPRKKRCELTQSAMKKVNIHECDVVVSFS